MTFKSEQLVFRDGPYNPWNPYYPYYNDWNYPTYQYNRPYKTDIITSLKEETKQENKMLETKDISTEQWREYEFGPQNNRVTYRIDSPVSLYTRPGGTTHRVVDKDNIVHCVPAPGEKGCVLRWLNKDTSKPVNF